MYGRQRGASLVVFWYGADNIPVATDARLEGVCSELEVESVTATCTGGFSPIEARGTGRDALRFTEFDLFSGSFSLLPVIEFDRLSGLSNETLGFDIFRAYIRAGRALPSVFRTRV